MKDEKFQIKLNVQIGESLDNLKTETYSVDVDKKMVVLDAVHELQATQLPELAVRWNCKAGKCGSCSAEVNGKPKLMCMSKLSDYNLKEPISIRPMKTFPLIKDLVTDVSWNYEVNKRIKPYNHPNSSEYITMQQIDVDRVQEFRKCIECFLCQNVCHILRDHDLKDKFVGPRFLLRLASLNMHPLDTENRLGDIKDEFGLGYCNITKCCTEVCPEIIPITDEAIIPLKERVVDEFYDPIKWFLRKLFPKK
ncbi:MAG: succinate dehydrogenase/fumarate reductase iron-sulfur subunit [Candidatus Heimdallarchaeota archaeon]|nr:succinate dehydrogenase/fumarate reductase iron-sulfur subunit [Candidatus Heimdallarchaeota archaeon]MDH5645976.1 succinate dehydrogenase/fumarate reductase iron-sulfur subunit [Candidatus Heimdallarchaeota archaeon]